MPGEHESEQPRRSRRNPGRKSARPDATNPAGQQTVSQLLEAFLAELEGRIARQKDEWARADEELLAMLAQQVSEALRGTHAAPFTAIAAQLDAATLTDDAEIMELFEKLESLTRLCREAMGERADDDAQP